MTYNVHIHMVCVVFRTVIQITSQYHFDPGSVKLYSRTFKLESCLRMFQIRCSVGNLFLPWNENGKLQLNEL